jgi:hypothetical protein
MKIAILAPLVILAGVGAIVALDLGRPVPGSAPAEPGPRAPETAGQETGVFASRPSPRYVTPPSEREQWARMRPPEEALLPDPDGIGPCPPPHLNNGAGASRVVRRFLNEERIPTWLHEDGGITQIRPDKRLAADGRTVIESFSFVHGAPGAPARIDMRNEDPRGQTPRPPQPDRTRSTGN